MIKSQQELISIGKKTLRDLTTVTELEAFLTRPVFRLDHNNHEHDHWDEFKGLLRDDEIAPETWRCYIHEPMDKKGFNLTSL
ncbi:MAG: hypothetical protein ACFFFG_10080 [Candidatus Thorarchaeota archaeon]